MHENEQIALVKPWLEAWAEAIRDQDLERGRAMFAEHASGFGTITKMTESRDDLVTRQWAPVWRRTEGFEFDYGSLKCHTASDALLTCVQSLWRSYAAPGETEKIERHGRATLVLVRDNTAAPWRCVHSHISLTPSGPDRGALNS